MRWSIPVTAAAAAILVASVSLRPSPAAAQRFGGGFRDGYGGYRGGYGGYRGGYGGYRGYGFGPAFGVGVGVGLLGGGYYGGYYPRPVYAPPPVVYVPPPVVYEPPVAYLTPAPRRVRPRSVVHHVAASCVRLPAVAPPAATAAPPSVAPAPRHDVYPPESP